MYQTVYMPWMAKELIKQGFYVKRFRENPNNGKEMYDFWKTDELDAAIQELVKKKRKGEI